MALALSVEGSTGVLRPIHGPIAFLSACRGTCSPLEREVHVESLLSACGCGGFLRPPSWSACILPCKCRCFTMKVPSSGGISFSCAILTYSESVQLE
eukprot:scaffold70211_cov66-Phaeocystis_antarctica.AAC.1